MEKKFEKCDFCTVDPGYGDGSAGSGVQVVTTQLIVHHAYYDDPAVTITGTTNFPIGNNRSERN